MSITFEFLKECGVFILSTINEEAPAARPFGAVMEHNGELYFSTTNMKDVYFQLIKNPQIQIVAMKSGTREWIRILGQAHEVLDLNSKQMMLDVCPVLMKRFDSKESDNFALFKIINMTTFLFTDNGSKKLC